MVRFPRRLYSVIVMKNLFPVPATIVAVLIAVVTAPSIGADGPWRSSLYPEDWAPGFSDDSGRFLQDFSYAGYHRGDRPLPSMEPDSRPVIDVTEPPFLADSSGSSDATLAIREAIEYAGKLGGGVVYLPEGTYLVSPQTTEEKAALYIDLPGVVLRGDGADRTFIFNTETSMRKRSVIRVVPEAIRDSDFAWRHSVGEPSYPLEDDVLELETTVEVSGGDFAVGDWVLVMSDATEAFISRHGMTGTWTTEGIGGLTFYRQVTAVNGDTLTLDIPIRYPVRRVENARIRRTIPHLEEVGIENLAIGMKEQTYGSMGDGDWNTPGTGAWEVHASSLIELNHAVNSWVRDVSSYLSPENFQYHLLSTGIRLQFSRSITLDNVDLARSQYRGEGGNGYHFAIQGSDNLLTHCRSERARHNYTFALIATTGNVIHRSEALSGRLPVDFHMHLSPANLIDVMVLDDDTVEAVRRTHADHGHGTTQSVFWNTRGNTEGWEVDVGIKKLIRTAQYGWGYAIGTSGPDKLVDAPNHQLSFPTDFVEGQSRGGTLIPSSLYEAQLERRHSLPPAPRSGGAGRRYQP